MRQRRTFELLTRFGLAVRGLLYIAIGLLVIGTGRAEDVSGVLAYLAEGSGKWLLVAVAAGFAGYGLWRLADAALAIESEGEKHEGWKRLGAATSGVVHLYLANQAWDVLEGAASLSGDSADAQAQTLLNLPAGQLLLGAAAIALAAAGIVQLARAVTCSFLRCLSAEARDSWVKWLGRAGYAARGIVFLIAAFFAARAAIENRSSLAGGVEQALGWLSSPLDLLVVGGLMLFGVYGLIEAWYRRIHAIDGAEAKRRVAEQVPG